MLGSLLWLPRQGSTSKLTCSLAAFGPCGLPAEYLSSLLAALVPDVRAQFGSFPQFLTTWTSPDDNILPRSPKRGSQQRAPASRNGS